MTVKGLKSLNRKLTLTIPQRALERTKAAMEKGADEIVALAKSLVPVDTGRLRDSIDWTWGAAPEGSVILAQSTAVGDGDLRITIYAGVRGNNNYSQGFYVRFVEFGTRKMAAQPFFYVSWRALKRRTKSRITREMRKGIREGAR